MSHISVQRHNTVQNILICLSYTHTNKIKSEKKPLRRKLQFLVHEVYKQVSTRNGVLRNGVVPLASLERCVRSEGGIGEESRTHNAAVKKF